MAATLIVHYSNGYDHNFKDATKIHTASNLRRWATTLVKDNEDIDGATLYPNEEDMDDKEYF